MTTCSTSSSSRPLRDAFGAFPSGVVALCAEVEGERVGMVASTFVGVSLEPALVTTCIQSSSTTWPRLRRAECLGISVLGQSHDVAARTLASRSGDRFEHVTTTQSDGGAVFVNDACAWLAVTIDQEIPAGDHSIVLMNVEWYKVLDELPIVFHRSRFSRLVND